MRDGVNAILAWGALAALFGLPGPGLADPGPEGLPAQEGEQRWVPSFAITSGITFQKQEGSAESELIRGTNPVPIGLQPRCPTSDPSCSPIPLSGDDVTAVPFVGAALEVMSPALPIPTRPRFFVSAEILPVFASQRALAVADDPTCVRGPEPNAPCAVDETGSARRTFSETSANGQGIRTDATVDTLVYGAGLGVAFPLWLNEWQLRIKPAFVWTSYEIDAQGLVVNAACSPPDRCVTFSPFGIPIPGFLRQPESLQASANRRFDAIGPGLDVEVDTGRFGPIGTSLFLGGRAFYTLGDRSFSFGTTQVYNDQVGMDVANARFEVEVNPWMFRTQLGVRFHWLGSEE